MRPMTLLLGAVLLAAPVAFALPAAAQKHDMEQKEETPPQDGKTPPAAKPPIGDKPPADKPPMGDEKVEITGVWQVAGANAGGRTYRGRAAVRRVGDVYRVVWRIGRSTYWGVGILTGNVLSVAYNGGLAVYTVTASGLRGRWTTLRGARILTENWSR